MNPMQKIDIEAHVAKARNLFKTGYNCAQSVFLTYNDFFGVDDTMAATLSAPLGGGMGRLREVCGAVSGMSLAAGLLCPACDPTDREAKAANYALVQEFAEKFRAYNGAIVCRELLGLTRHKDTPQPEERTEEYYRKRPCIEYVADAVRIIGEKINENTEERV